ncbi:hypothetical protein GV828_11150 [Flavobacterium sp. NST-5]|uniref:Uncharacterized protein n=1 Tax=Flavobacterium ichthyis TaxID=2698827 RepID=A0ABW9ZER9_9FLAO|nr:hypothetical protein [Flavobacterium ichthyis]NBL65757.1 hypothetical protein [Flavobacterium ichthyis]
MSLTLMSFSDSNSRKPFTGEKVETIDVDCGSGCTCTYTITTQYVFWINVGSTRELTKTSCPE